MPRSSSDLQRAAPIEDQMRVFRARIAVGAERLGDGLRWQEARGGNRFPHSHGRLEARLRRRTDGRSRFTEEIGP
jgi:uncharacterized protein (DUF952 family)